MWVAIGNLFDDIAQPQRRLHGPKTMCVVFVQQTRLTKMFKHGCFSIEDSRHGLANEKHNPHVRIIGDSIEAMLQLADFSLKLSNEKWEPDIPLDLNFVRNINNSVVQPFLFGILMFIPFKKVSHVASIV